MASSLALVVICILSTSSYSSPTTDLLETVSRLLRDCSRFYPHADRNMAENLVVRLQVAVDSVRRLVESLDPDDQGNDVRIPELESLHWTPCQIWVNGVISQDNSGNTAVRDIFDDNSQPDELYGEDPTGPAPG
ncbi:unnamed protein product [Porites lobata]|uniref:Uncharacterized protein n=1 Tax=Porites lobata TaxID=104759 RepID=A0ABN8N5Z4_9CNID|nr:unnamed protein product [Porites lobata]